MSSFDPTAYDYDQQPLSREDWLKIRLYIYYWLLMMAVLVTLTIILIRKENGNHWKEEPRTYKESINEPSRILLAPCA
jgi:hypothetical protein